MSYIADKYRLSYIDTNEIKFSLVENENLFFLEVIKISLSSTLGALRGQAENSFVENQYTRNYFVHRRIERFHG